MDTFNSYVSFPEGRHSHLNPMKMAGDLNQRLADHGLTGRLHDALRHPRLRGFLEESQMAEMVKS